MNNTVTAQKTKWGVDPAHSEITFKVRHMMIASVTGQFESFTAIGETNGDSLEGAHFSFSADVASVNTHAADRDTHLRSGDFFDADNYPQLTFESTSVSADSITGNMTIKGVTKAVTLNMEYGGSGKDPWGNTRIGITVSGMLNRRDFDLNWNAALETGGVLVSDEVKINAEIQFIAQ